MKPEDPKPPALPNFGRSIGEFYNEHTGGSSPMGSWTGLPALAGAPISGALWGAGLGALVGGGQKAMDWMRGEERPKRPWWQQPWALGLGAGTALGVASGIAQLDGLPRPLNTEIGVPQPGKTASLSKRAVSADSVVSVLWRDPSITPYEKGRLIAAVQKANPQQLQRMMTAAVAGTLTAGIAYGILGMGAWASAGLGGAVGLVTRNFLPGRPQYV